MKKKHVQSIILATLILLFSLKGFSQLEKGRKMINTNLNYYSQTISQADTSSKKNTSTNIYRNSNTGLSCGYFVSNHFVIGLSYNYSFNYTKNENKNPNIGFDYNTYTSKSLSSTHGIGIFTRAYKKMFKDKFAFFGQASLSYNLGKTNSVTKNQGFVPNETKSSSNNFGFGLSVSPGITYFFNRKIAVEAGIGSFNFKITKSNNYSQQGKLTYTSVNSNTYFSFSPASMYFGINFFFGGSDKLQTPKVAQ